MNKAQIAILGFALVSGVAAFTLLQPEEKPPAAPQAAAPPPPQKTAILVAAQPLQFGAQISENNIRWQPWPKDIDIPDAIRQDQQPNAIGDFKGAVVRGQFSQNEPIRKDTLIKGPNANFMATLISAGKRAVSITIDAAGSNSAGGFVLPNDRVDIVRTYRDEEASKTTGSDVTSANVILENVKVLAIGPNVTTENGRAVVNGVNATLELDLRQAETIILAQRTGVLSLVLRPLVDALANGETKTLDQPTSDSSLTVVRYGTATIQRGK